MKAEGRPSLSNHFILFQRLPLIYARVPKVANTSVKAALTRLLEQPPKEGFRTTTDAFWRKGTNGETTMVDAEAALTHRSTHFIFSFVRNPFDRLVSAYNNKLQENDELSTAMQQMGLQQHMPFDAFVKIVADTTDQDLDVHLLPQSRILCADSLPVPGFIGLMEAMDDHWRLLRRRMRQFGLPPLGKLPTKNVRRGGTADLSHYFGKDALIDLALTRYRQDVELFYPNQPIDALARGTMTSEPTAWERLIEPVGSLA